MRLVSCSVLVFALLASACSTTQEVTLTKTSTPKSIASVAQVLDADNSNQMNSNLASALQKEALTIKPTLPQGTKTSAGVDALISYVDVWRWDLVMYLKNLTVKLHDAETGDLLVLGQWSDSPLHGFRDAKLVMEGLVAEVMAKARTLAKAPPK